ncbi:MAG: hypothetical protein HGA98_02535 [Deltaproteobacteria bacterium]|nr:hypothetical protein [Deltaproteobacteria bacterium]
MQTPAGRLKPVPVVPGISDGIKTVVTLVKPDSLPEGTEVVTAIMKEAEAATKNPFAPPRLGGPRPGR